MSKLHSIAPVEEVERIFSCKISVCQLGMDSIHDMYTGDAEDDILNMSLNVWNRIVESGSFGVDPNAIAPCFERMPGGCVIVQKEELVDRISECIGEPMISDISYTRCTLDDTEEEKLCCKVVVAKVFPNDLHVAQITLQDPRYLVADPRYGNVKFKGLGLSGVVMERVDELASRGLVETGETGREARAMEKRVASPS